MSATMIQTGRAGTGSRKAKTKASCEQCYFRRNLLCALTVDEACPTFRPDSPDGLQPPRQLRFAFPERGPQAVYSFPTASEQAALYS